MIIMTITLTNNSGDTKLPIFNLFNLLVETSDYYFHFNYIDKNMSFDLKNVSSILFYAKELIINASDGSRYLFAYSEMNNVKVICLS